MDIDSKFLGRREGKKALQIGLGTEIIRNVLVILGEMKAGNRMHQEVWDRQFIQMNKQYLEELVTES